MLPGGGLRRVRPRAPSTCDVSSIAPRRPRRGPARARAGQVFASSLQDPSEVAARSSSTSRNFLSETGREKHLPQPPNLLAGKYSKINTFSFAN